MTPTTPPDDRPTADRREGDRALDASVTRSPFADAPPTDVPDGTTPERCPYCDRPLPGDHLLALHLGERHPERLTSEERAAYESANEREADDLFVYHLKVVAAIVLVVMGLSYVYVFALA